MLKNIWYCIKKTSEWYFALLVLYIILTLVNATIPILSAFLPKLVIEKLTLGSDIKGLIGTIMVFMGSIAVLTGVSKFLTKYLYFEKFSINVHYLKLVANKGLTTDYINQENGIFRKLQEESFLCCNGHSPLTQKSINTLRQIMDRIFHKTDCATLTIFWGMYSLAKVTTWQSSSIGCFFVAHF